MGRFHVDIEDHAGSLMRANSMASKQMKSFTSIIGGAFLKQVLGGIHNT